MIIPLLRWKYWHLQPELLPTRPSMRCMHLPTAKSASHPIVAWFTIINPGLWMWGHASHQLRSYEGFTRTRITIKKGNWKSSFSLLLWKRFLLKTEFIKIRIWRKWFSGQGSPILIKGWSLLRKTWSGSKQRRYSEAVGNQNDANH